MAGHTHRLSNEEWNDFLATRLLEKYREDPSVFTDVLPRALTRGVGANLTNFQILSCQSERDEAAKTGSISCLGWQPNEIPSLGTIQKFPRFSAGN